MRNIVVLIAIVIALAVVSFFILNNDLYQQGQTVDPKAAEEGAPEGVDTEPLAADSLAGVWQSVDDPKFIRTIYENGGYVDSYEGAPDSSINGPWVTFTADNAPTNVPFTLEAEALYLELDSGDDPLYFKVVSLTDIELVLIYLSRGNTLRFTRVVE